LCYWRHQTNTKTSAIVARMNKVLCWLCLAKTDQSEIPDYPHGTYTCTQCGCDFQVSSDVSRGWQHTPRESPRPPKKPGDLRQMIQRILRR